jgi:hypothetical protein
MNSIHYAQIALNVYTLKDIKDASALTSFYMETRASIKKWGNAMNLKSRINKLESRKSGGFSQSLIETLNRAKERVYRNEKSPEPTITEAELNEIIATNKENSMAAKIARAQLRRLHRLQP